MTPRYPLEEAATLLREAAVVIPHTDADGLAAGAIALRERGEPAEAAILLKRGETPFGVQLPEPPAILDWGIRALAGPALIVDHHVPEAEPQHGQVFLTSFGEEPEVSTAPLMRRIAPDQPPWLAAVGAFGDLGAAGLALPECEGARKTSVRKITPLVNAPRRLPDGPVLTALALLVEHDDPAELLRDPRCEQLDEARRTCKAEFDRVVRTAPTVGERVAVLRFSTPCQAHPLVATAWARRLAPRPVIAANDDYLPGMVNFSVRGGGDSDLVQLLREALPEAEGEFAHGHRRATGGSLTPDEFELLLRRLGASGA